MKKIILGSIALLGSGLSFAQSSVTVFGVADSAIEYTKAQGTGAITRLVSGSNTPSKIGFRGSEDLGGGLSAAFWLEAAFFLDTGAGGTTNLNNTPSGALPNSLAFNRRSTVSLLGRFGEVRMGRDVVASSLNYVEFDTFRGVGIGNSSAVMLSNGVFSNATALRASNTVSYFLPPDLGGWYGNIMGALGENPSGQATTAAGGKHDGDYYGARIGYRKANLNVALSAGRTRYDQLPTSSAVAGNVDRINLGASYDLGMVRLISLVSTERRARGTGGVASNFSFSIGGIVPSGPSDFILQYAQVKQNAIAGSHDARQISAGWVYNLSKRTALYTTLSWLDNRGNSKIYVLNTTGGFSTPATTIPGGNITGFDLGIRHSF